MIRVENLWKKFGRFDALRGLSFEVPQGSAFAMIGANGAGKTTMIKVLMNILEPTRGSATIPGRGFAKNLATRTGTNRIRLRKPGHAAAIDRGGIRGLSAAVLSQRGTAI